MKTKLFFLLLLGQLYSSYGQSIQINQITPTAVSGGVNVNLIVTTFNGAGYLSHTYTVNGNTINLSVCYWFNFTLPVFQINNDFVIPVQNNTNYTINVSTFNSSSATVCDFYSAGPTGTVNYLEIDGFEKIKEEYTLFPNPTQGKVAFNGDEILINKITIYDNFGRLIKQLKDTTDTYLDLKELNDGMYFVKIETENGSLNQKIILKK